MLGNQLLNSVPGFEEDLNRLKGWTMYNTYEAGKRRSVNHTRALARLAGPGRAGPGRAGPWPRPRRGAARRGAAGRPDGRCGARARARPDVTCRCGAVRRDVLR